MEYWLQLFHDCGYIDWNPKAGALRIERIPGAQEIEQARRPINEAFA